MKYKQYAWIPILVCTVLMVSCNKKDAYMGYTPGNGVPTITSVHTLSKTFYNDTVTTTSQSYDSSGNLSTTTGTSVGDSTIAFDSVTNAGNLGNYYVIHGTNLGSATAVYFNGMQAYFNRSLGTDQTIVVAIPSKTPYYGPNATDSLVVTTLNGKASYKFTIIAPPPTPTTYSDYNFSSGSQMSLTGVGFLNVTSVYVVDADSPTDSASVSIVSQNDSLIVLQFPSATMNQGYLKFNYTTVSGGANLIAKQELVDLDNAYQILGPKTTADPSQTWAAVYQNNGVSTGWVANGWSSWSTSTSVVKGSGISFYGKFDNGGWKVAGFQFNTGVAGSIPALAYNPSYQYLSFWVINKGVAVAQTAYIQWGDNIFGQNKVNPITISPNGWQYFKIPISSLNWNSGSTPWSANISLPLNDVGFFLTCQDAAGNNVGEADLYFTNVVLVK